MTTSEPFDHRTTAAAFSRTPASPSAPSSPELSSSISPDTPIDRSQIPQSIPNDPPTHNQTPSSKSSSSSFVLVEDLSPEARPGLPLDHPRATTYSAKSKASQDLIQLASNNAHDMDASASSDRRGSYDATADTSNIKAQRTHSILNLTSSTLLGIYSPSGLQSEAPSVNPSEPPTPGGLGSQTPSRSLSIDNGFHKLAFTPLDMSGRQPKQQAKGHTRKKSRSVSMHLHHRTRAQATRALAARAVLMIVLGVAYGELIKAIHDSRGLSPVQVAGIDRRSPLYVSFWAVAAVGFGFLMPWIDMRVSNDQDDDESAIDMSGRGPEPIGPEDEDTSLDRTGLGADWNPIVRNIGAFVGLAFAIHRVPWSSTLQVSLTLALVNPFIWFLLDRSVVGFSLSTVVAIAGASTLMLIKPDMIPTPTASTSLRDLGLTSPYLAGSVSYETIGVATWIASVLFCSCIVFGNIGRRLLAQKKIVQASL